MIDWLFRNRRTGRLTVVQFPNVYLGLFLVAAVIGRLASPHGGVRMAVGIVAGVSLFWWAADEVIRGVNPFRRLLGATVIAALAVGTLRS